MRQLKQLAGQTVIYGASSVIGRALNFLLVPLYTSVLDPGEYGVVTDLYALAAFLNILYTYGFETTYFRFVSQNRMDSKKYYNLAQTSILTSSIFFSVLLMVFSDSIAGLMNYEGKGHYLRWLAWILAIDAIVAVPFARLRLENRSLRFALIKLLNILVNIGFNLFFLVFCPWWIEVNGQGLISAIYTPDLGVGYIFLSNLIANALYLLFLSNYLTDIRFNFDQEWKKMIKYAYPLAILGFAGVTNEMLSRAFLKYILPLGFYPDYTNQEVLGIFGACYKLSVFMTLAVQAFRYAFEPFFFTKSSDKNSPAMFANIMHGFVIFGSFSWLLISILLPDFAPLVLRQDDYLTGLGIVPWLLGGGLFLGIYFNLSLWYKLTDKNLYGAWITIFGAALTIILNVLLIPAMGYMGSAITTFLSYLSMVLISYYYGQKHYRIPYHTGKGLFYITIAGLSILAFYFWSFDQIYKYFIAIGLLAFYGIMVWLLDIRTGTFKKET